MLGDKAHIAHAFHQFRKQSSGLAKFGSAWREAAGLDISRQRRRAFARVLKYATTIGSMRAAIGYWQRVRVRKAIMAWNQAVQDRFRMLTLLRKSFSHHKLVLLQAIVKEWYIAIRHEVIARRAYYRSAFILAFGKLNQHAQQLNRTNSVAYVFLLNSQSALLRSQLRNWRVTASRRLARQQKSRCEGLSYSSNTLYSTLADTQLM